ncbi:TetR/AcrR family transcriptional regulator [Paenibacillus sp. MER 99-2]|uniref:TetR/AcrR family transcriptional regulator n=1 Tax=Paenibacillus sp. MER 99-2 TaxID=2939572 RepID=UPI00203DD2D6|nr:TetR/AcrR family transcriptional regulator [Paenibacillus sp. MER 99-2]MCM3173851.1 TetR/AcrR family transcriptional regulator [Paenibacillus sp. MER 99-2]
MKNKPHSDSKKKDILQAAMRLFATKGVDGISVKEIGDAAGVTDAAIYKHFKNKDAVALEAFTQYCADYTALIDGYVRQEGTVKQRLRQLFAEVLEIHDADPYGLLLISQNHEIFIEVGSSEDYRQPLDALIDLIDQGIVLGELPAQDSRLTGVMIIGAITHLAVSSMQGQLPEQLVPYTGETIHRLMSMLGDASQA